MFPIPQDEGSINGQLKIRFVSKFNNINQLDHTSKKEIFSYWLGFRLRDNSNAVSIDKQITIPKGTALGPAIITRN